VRTDYVPQSNYPAIQTSRAFQGNGDSAENPSVTVETHSVALRPWRRNQAAITATAAGFTSLSELMNSIRDHMDARAADRMSCWRTSPPCRACWRASPKSNRLQGETLMAIHQQLLHQAQQQERWAKSCRN